MADSPQVSDRPVVRVELRFINFGTGQVGQEIALGEWSKIYTKFEFTSMINNGYSVKAKFVDAYFSNMDKLIEANYFVNSKDQVLEMSFIISASPGSTVQVKKQIAYVTSMHIYGITGNKANIVFHAIDPASWFLNTGNASGKAFKGKISEVIAQVVDEYSDAQIDFTIDATKDSDNNYWYMMRQDPKTFIMSLLKWSDGLNETKTQWLIKSDNMSMSVLEQGKVESKSITYLVKGQGKQTHIHDWEILGDNSMYIITDKLITSGISRVSGKYYDKITEQKTNKVEVFDETTSKKQIAKTPWSYHKRIHDSQTSGYTHINSVPEIYSAGDLGLTYDEYIDGKARNLWLGLTNRLLRVCFTCYGDQNISSSLNLGVDTLLVRWDHYSSSNSVEDPKDPLWFPTGNWIIYGFTHIVERGSWYTKLYCARHFSSDSNPSAKLVGAES